MGISGNNFKYLESNLILKSFSSLGAKDWRRKETFTLWVSTYLIPYFERRSLDNGAVINFLLMCDGAVKCRFLCFLDDAETFLFNFMVNQVLDTTLKSKSQSQFGVVCATSLEVATIYHFLQDGANHDGEPFWQKWFRNNWMAKICQKYTQYGYIRTTHIRTSTRNLRN